MNNLRNRVQLIGNLGTTPEVIALKEGRKLVKLTLATNDTYKNKRRNNQRNPMAQSNGFCKSC